MFSFLKPREGEEEKGSLRAWIILIAAVAGVALILFGSRSESKKKETDVSSDPLAGDELILYQSYLEERIKKLCESVDGVGSVTALVTLEGGFESVYATELSDGDEVYVIVGSGSNAEALFLSRTAPTVSGIGVVCGGGKDPSVRAELISLISATLHIPSNRIYITSTGK